LVFVGIATIVRAVLTPLLDQRASWLFFYPSVVATAWAFGLGPGILSIGVSTWICMAVFTRAGRPLFPISQFEWMVMAIYVGTAGCIVALGVAHKNYRERLVKEALERRRAEESLTESLEMFRGVFDNAKDTAIILSNTEKRVVAWNAGAVAMFGWSEREASAKQVEELLGGEADESRQSLESGEHASSAERWMKKKGGVPLWGAATTAELHFQDGRVRGYITIVRDMTERRNYEDLLRSQNEELDRRVHERTADLMQANAELEGFTYSVSHDMRGPLRGIVGNSSMLLEDYSEGLDPSAQAMLRRLSVSALKMSSLVDDLLSYARLGKQRPAMVETDLSALFLEVVEEETTGMDTEIVCPPGIIAFGDPGLLRMVFQNLVGNAVKYRVRTQRLHLEFGSEVVGSETIFSVTDNGLGFDMAYQAKLFEPFERLHRSEDIPGTGIGLANVKRIIERHGGRVWAEGALGEGAKFLFTLA